MPIKIDDMELYESKEISEMLGVHIRTVWKMIREGKLPGRKLGRKWYVPAESFKEYFLSEAGQKKD